MVTQKDLETLLHVSQVRDLGRDFSEARIKGKIGEGPTALSDVELKKILAEATNGDRAFFVHDSPEHVSNYVDQYTILSDQKSQDTPGYKAFIEYTKNRDKVIGEYLTVLNKENSDKQAKIIAEAKKEGKKIENEDLKVIFYQKTGAEIQELSRELSRETIAKIAKTGSDEEKEILQYLLRSESYYEDSIKNKDKLASDLSKRSGVEKSWFNITDASARNYAETQKAFDARKIGKYFSEQEGVWDRFFLDSPYAIAKMAQRLPKQ